MLNLEIHLNFQSVVSPARKTAVFFVIVSEHPSRFIYIKDFGWTEEEVKLRDKTQETQMVCLEVSSLNTLFISWHEWERFKLSKCYKSPGKSRNKLAMPHSSNIFTVELDTTDEKNPPIFGHNCTFLHLMWWEEFITCEIVTIKCYSNFKEIVTC